MPKEIKAIECPKCGSTQKIELKPDFFRCVNCNTEYFLDNDDITVNHNVSYKNSPLTDHAASNTSSKLRWKLIIICTVIIAAILITITVLITSQSGVYNQASSVPDGFRWWQDDATVYLGDDQKLILVTVRDRHDNGLSVEGNKGSYASFYDLMTGKEIKNQALPPFPSKPDNTFDMKMFRNGEIYVIASQSAIFKINKSACKVEDISKTVLSKHPEFISGLANAEYTAESYVNSFNLINNEGKNYFYFPITDKMYNKEELAKAKTDLETLAPSEKTIISYAFSDKSHDYPDENLQLMKYVRKDNKGGPDNEDRFEWSDNGSPGYQYKTLARGFGAAMVSFNDLTPGRVYFEPHILYGDKDYVLISLNKTPAEKAATSVQCINANTGAVVFTFPFTENKNFDDDVIRYKDGFVVRSTTSFYVIGMDGKLIKEYKLAD